MGRSHEYEWHGRVTRRFATEAKARAFAEKARHEFGWYDVSVVYFPVRP